MAMFDVISNYYCRICNQKGHTPSYCPVNAQMARQSQANLDDHKAWQGYRKGRTTLASIGRRLATVRASVNAQLATSEASVTSAH